MISIPPELPLATPLALAITCDAPPELRGRRGFNAEAYRVGELRDELAGGVGASADFADGTICTMPLPENLQPGLYKLTSFRVQQSPPQGEDYVELLDRSGPFQGCLHFLITEDGESGASPTDAAEAAYAAREALIASPHITPQALLMKQPTACSGFVLCHGAVLHTRQDLKGISLVPYGNGLDYSPLLQSASEFTNMAWGFAVAHDPRIADDYGRQTSTCAIFFHEVRAANAADALKYVAAQAEDVITIIGLDRGFKPVPFATFVYDGANYHGHFYYGRYTGNLLAPFSPGQVGQTIETHLPRMRKSPRARLLLETYAEATAERDYAFRHLRYWALLELLAKDAIPSNTDNIYDAHGHMIVDAQSQPIKTRGAAAKVYKYIFDGGTGATSSGYSEGSEQKTVHIEAQNPSQPNAGDEVLSLWEVVGALYEIRNQVAHSGTFIPDANAAAGSRLALASRFYRHQSELLFRFLKGETWLATLRELNKI